MMIDRSVINVTLLVNQSIRTATLVVLTGDSEVICVYFLYTIMEFLILTFKAMFKYHLWSASLRTQDSFKGTVRQFSKKTDIHSLNIKC